VLALCLEDDAVMGAIMHVRDVSYERGLTDGLRDGKQDGFIDGWLSGIADYDTCVYEGDNDVDAPCAAINCSLIGVFGTFRTPSPNQPTPEECRTLYLRQ
jgi:hypothetical protein